MPACAYCLDMTYEFADISVGSVEGIEGWNLPVCIAGILAISAIPRLCGRSSIPPCGAALRDRARERQYHRYIIGPGAEHQSHD